MEFRHAQGAERDLNDPRENCGGEQILDPVILHQGDDDQGHGTRCRRDHRRPATGEGDRDRHGERGVQADLGIDPGDNRERDRLGDQRERDNQPGKQLDPEYVQAWHLRKPQAGTK